MQGRSWLKEKSARTSAAKRAENFSIKKGLGFPVQRLASNLVAVKELMER